jgi:ABC-type transporter MlaC component
VIWHLADKIGWHSLTRLRTKVGRRRFFGEGSMLARLIGRMLICLTVAAGGHLGVAEAASDGAVDDFVARVNATVGSLKPGDAAGARAACTRLVEQAFDIDAMAPVTSAGAWPRMNAAQKKAYRAGLARRAVRDCASRSRDFAGQTMQLVGVRTGEGGDRFIAVKGKSRTAIWQVRGAGRLRAVDVSVSGRSLVVAAQKDAKRVLQNSGGDLQALIDSVEG